MAVTSRRRWTAPVQHQSTILWETIPEPGGTAMISVRFDDVAVFFTEDEWRSLEEWQKELYKDVMKENYQTLVFVDQPEIMSRLERGEDPCIRAQEQCSENPAPTERSERAEEELDMELQIDCPEELLEEEAEEQPQWDMLDILIFLDELFDLWENLQNRQWIKYSFSPLYIPCVGIGGVYTIHSL
ncbi:zinc finger protein 181-like isoform X2 [Phyllobates terribilis]|uniref:zinc finger protein 181-like isoform X2 n=1 Tax=Phyllobates terribilis TaxID=111132 RepID=UPI003CCAB2A2